MMMAVMDHLPVGYRFHPTDEELLWHYLWRKNLGEDQPFCVIPEVDLCSWEPEDLRGKFLGELCFCFRLLFILWVSLMYTEL